MKYFLIQGKYGGPSASWFQIVLASNIEEAKGLALLNEANIKWGEEKEIDISPDYGDNEIEYLEVPESYDKEFLVLIGSTEEYFRFYALDEEALLIESAIELNSSLKEINLKEFLEVYLNRKITDIEAEAKAETEAEAEIKVQVETETETETNKEISPLNNTEKDTIIF